MRVWDIHPGFLNRQSLLGEHREIHAIHTILSQGKKGYSRHPETLRWRDHLAALWLRHEQVAAEMRARGFKHLSPLAAPRKEIIWPKTFIDPPERQFALLAKKYTGKEQGRISLPTSVNELLDNHALSLISREYTLEGESGGIPENFATAAKALVHLLREPQTGKGWAEVFAILKISVQNDADLLAVVQKEARDDNQLTVLNELLLWP